MPAVITSDLECHIHAVLRTHIQVKVLTNILINATGFARDKPVGNELTT